MEGKLSCYRCGQFNIGRMVMLQRWPFEWMENSHVTEVVSWSENGHVTEVASLMEGEWSLQRWPF